MRATPKHSWLTRKINSRRRTSRALAQQAPEDGCTVNAPESGLRRIKVHRSEAESYEVAEAEKLLRSTPVKWRALIGLAVRRPSSRRDPRVAVGGYRLGGRPCSRQATSSRSTRLRRQAARRCSAVQRRPAAVAAFRCGLSSENFSSCTRWCGGRTNRPRLRQRRRPPGRRSEPVSRVYKPAARRAGLRESRFHDLRHTFVTYCAAAGFPLVKVADWVGHSDSRITDVYRHASADSEDFALGLLDRYDDAIGATASAETD